MLPKSLVYLLFSMFLLFCPGRWVLHAGPEDSLRTVIREAPEESRAGTYADITYRLITRDARLAIVLGLEALSTLDSNRWSSERYAIMHNIADAYFFTGNFPQALDYCHMAMKGFRVLNDLNEQAAVYISLSRIYGKAMKDCHGAAAQLKEAERLYIQSGNASELATIRNYLGNNVEDCDTNYEKALGYYYQSLKYYEGSGDSLGLSYSYDFISQIYGKQQRFREALELQLKALDLRYALHDSVAIAIGLTNVGEIYAKQGDLEQAEAYFTRSVTLAERIRYKDLQVYAYGQLSEICRKKGDIECAYTFIEKQFRVKDELINETASRQLIEQQSRFDLETKEQKILLLSKENELAGQRTLMLGLVFAGILAIIAFSVLVGIQVLRNRQQKREAEARIAQEKIRASAVIEAEETERVRIARELHDGVGQLLVASKMGLSALSQSAINDVPALESSIALMDEAIREVRDVSHAMMPNALLRYGLQRALEELAGKMEQSFPGKIRMQVSGFGGDSDLRTETILYRVVQEVLSNAVKHAQASQITIDLNRFDDEISLVAEDNGRGFDKSSRENAKGIGLENICSRIRYLGGDVQFETAPGKGTTVIITIPGSEN